ncbi:MAG: cytochrome c [Deltaproteobacteria bacterium]|nr:cytochrome c [Deltaproteobacteria bacterium]
MSRNDSSSFLAPALICCGCLAACRQDMHDQPKIEPLEASPFFSDGRGSRPLLASTVARGLLREDDHLHRGRVGGQVAEDPPFAIDRALVDRGRERFDVFCAPCHDRVGTGRGMVVRRGLRSPPSFHVDRLRRAPIGHFFDVMTSGFGLMASYSSQIPPEDRWAIAAYVRCLQLAQHARIGDVPAQLRPRLTRPSPPTQGNRQRATGNRQRASARIRGVMGLAEAGR